MAVTGNVFFSGVDQAVLTGWGTAGRFKLALFASAPALTVVDFNGADLSTGNGYTEGGLALPSLSHTVTAAASWPVSWTSGNAYTVNNIVKSSGNTSFLYRCVVAGTAGGSAPTQATEGALDTASTGAQFVNCGQSIEVWSSASAIWTASGGSIGPASYGVIYDSVNGSSAGANLLLISFGVAQTATNGNTFTVAPDPNYGWFSSLPQ